MSTVRTRRTWVAVAMCCGLVWASAAQAQVKISQIYGGGGNVGANYNADFVEIYNTSSSPVDLSTYSIHYAAATGTTWTRVALIGFIPGNGYYLARLTTPSATVGATLPTPDFVAASPDMAAAAGKVALFKNAGVAATGQFATAPSGSTLIDFVGYGATADAREAGGLPGFPAGTTASNAPAPSVTTSVQRSGCGATDTNVNSADFSADVPNPRNTRSPANNGLTGRGTPQPTLTVAQGATITLQVAAASIVPCSGAAPVIDTVTADASMVGGPASLPMGLNGANYEASVTISPQAFGQMSVPFLVTETPAGRTGGGVIPLNVTAAAAPGNDVCTATYNNALYEIPSGGGLIWGTNVGATNDAPGVASCTNATGNASTNSSAANLTVWYTITPNSTGLWTFSTCQSGIYGSTMTDSVVAVFSGTDCATATQITCDDDSCGFRAEVVANLTSGTKYLVRVSGFGSGTGSFILNVTAPAIAAPSNDDCSSAIPLTLDTPISGTMAGATGVDVSTCGAGADDNDVWYTFTPNPLAPTTAYSIFVCATNGSFDSAISVYTGSCGTPTSVACDVDTATPGCGYPGSRVSATLTGGVTYLIRVSAEPGSTFAGTLMGGGPFTITVAAPAAPANESCATAAAVTITSGSGTATGNNFYGVTNPALDPSVAFGACGGAAATKDLYYSFNTGVGGAGSWRISTCSSTPQDTIIDVFTLCGDAAPLACNDDNAGCGDGTQSSLIVPGLLASTVYRVRVSSKGAGASGGPFTLAIELAVPPANNDCGTPTAIAAGGNSPGGVSGTNAFATLDGPPTACGGAVSVDKDVWFSFQPSVTASWDVSTCLNSAQDTVVEIFDNCGGLVVGCNDDTVGCGNGLQSKITAVLSSAISYRIRVASKLGSGGGAYNLLVALTPPANDECAGAIALTTGVTPIIMGGATNSTTPAACSSITKDVWFTYTATCPGTLTVTNCGQAPAGYDTVIAIYSGTCPAGLTQLVCNDGGGACGVNEAFASAAVSAGTHYIRVGTFSTVASANTSLDVSFTSNDLCANASPLTVGAAAVSSSFSCATFDGISSTCDLTGVDLWYSVTLATALPGNQALIIDTCGSATDTVLSAYSGNCAGPPVEIACNDECGGTPCNVPGSSCLSLNGLAAGTYRFRVSDKGMGGGGSFQIKASVAFVNDACAGAITVACGTAQTGTTVGTTLDTVPDCTNFAPSIANVGGNSSVTAGGVWYKFIGDGQTVTADTLTASYDSKLSVYRGPDCGSLTCVTMNDDIRADFHSKVAFATQPLETYWILVHGFGTATGTFTLNVTCAPTPTNNDCATATPISGAGGAIPGTIVGATAEPFTPNSNILATCATLANHPLFDVWYALTACSTGTLTLDTCGSYDTLLSVHSTCPTLTLGNQIAAACNDNGPVGCTPGSQLTFAVTQGTVYLVRVAGNIGQNAGAPFLLTWSLPDTTPPDITTCATDQQVLGDIACDGIVPDFTAGVVATDNCGTPTITQSPLAGSTVNGPGPHVITLTATDGSSNTDTCTANLTVTDPLMIVIGPQDVTGCVGGMAQFSVTANGANGYQWRRNTISLSNGGSISGATTATLTINPLIAADAGAYDCVVTSACGGSQTSTAAALTVNATPTISTQPVGGAVGVGAPFSFTVGANGGGLSYQWYFGVNPLSDGGTISGSNTPTLSISATALTDAGTYTVVVSNNCGSITSDPAVLVVNSFATVSLVAPPCVNGSQLVVDVLMSSAPGVIVGGQFFFAYNNTVLDFVSAAPGDAPFVREVYEVVNEPAGEINYAVGIDDGDSGTSANTVMARLTFNILQNVCTLTPNLVTWRASGPNGAENKLSDDQGQQVDINDVNLGAIRLDNVAPVITLCPSDINVHAAAGSCSSAPVTYAAAATDNCTDPGDIIITFSPPSGSTFTPGTHTVTVTATDECGNSSQCTFTVTNDGQTSVTVDVELGGGVMANGTFTRAITFALWNTTVDNVNPLHTTCVNMSFSGNFPAPKLGTATFLVPCQPTGYDCITGRDRVHTLRRTISPIPITGTAYTPSFTGAKVLIGGNLDDSKFIDILDFGIYTTQDLSLAPGGANTVCGLHPPGFLHADITGNGIVNSLDYSFISNNFLMTREDNCNGSPITVVAGDGRTGARERDLPITSITIPELQERGLGHLAVMDLNQDGVFDLTDKGLWEQGVRPNTGGTSPPAGGSPKTSQPMNPGTQHIPTP